MPPRRIRGAVSSSSSLTAANEERCSRSQACRHFSCVLALDRAAAVHTGAGAVAAEVAGAAVDVAGAPSAQRRQAGAAGAIAEAALSIRATGGSAVAAATTVPVAAGLTAATGLGGAAGSAPTGRARTASDEEVTGAGAAGIGVGARRSLWLAAEGPGDAVLDRLIALQPIAALWGLARNTGDAHHLTLYFAWWLTDWRPTTLLGPFLSILALLVALLGRGILGDRGQANEAGGKESEARASGGVGSEGLCQVIEAEVVHCSTSRADERALSGPERFGAVLPLQQPAHGSAVNEVTGCWSIR
jgi:hypothetical protein